MITGWNEGCEGRSFFENLSNCKGHPVRSRGRETSVVGGNAVDPTVQFKRELSYDGVTRATMQKRRSTTACLQ